MKTYLLALLLALAAAQNIGTQKQEYHIPFPYTDCDQNGCQTKNGEITLDENWRWIHNNEGYTNCFSGTEWSSQYCPDPATCTRNCAVDGVPQGDWANPYGTKQITNGIDMTLVTHGQYGDNVGARVYLLDSPNHYKMYKLLNREFTFDVDVSALECGLNGALYFVEMEPDGGSSKYPTNKAGAKYGTGYCDAQCPKDVKFICGEANCKDWVNDQGHYGSCCAEMDIWEANKWANAYTTHVCTVPGYYRCEGKECGTGSDRQVGNCDKDGCDLNPFRNGNKNFYGPGSSFTIDTTKKFTVVTQFISNDGTDNGDLSEVRRFYVQDGKKIETPKTNVSGLGSFNSLSNANCASQKRVFEEEPTFLNKGGMKAMGESLKRGMVLVLSLWDDHEANMLWLDSDYPLNLDPSKPGVKRGPCSRDSGKPADVERMYGNAHVGYSNVKFGTIGSTVKFEADGITLIQDEPSLKVEVA